MHTKTPLIANQMMKGPRKGRYHPQSTEESRQAFLDKYVDLIENIFDCLPRGSVAVQAVVVKCAIKYGEEKAKAFGLAVKKGNFQGTDDPAYHMYRMLIKGKNQYNTIGMYQRAVTLARAYCEDRKIKEISPASTDIFEWDENWEPILSEPETKERDSNGRFC